MKAIITKYLPFTNTKPSRIKASAEGVESLTLTLNWLETNGLPQDSPHITAAKIFAVDHHWPTNLASGGLPSGEWAHCFIPTPNK